MLASCAMLCAVARRGITKAEKRDAPVWGRLVECIDPRTHERFVAWRAFNGDDADEMRARGYRIGDELSAEFRADRSLNNFRQAHALAKFVRDNTDDFPPDMDTHEVLKRLQKSGDIECDEEPISIDLGQFGRHEGTVRVARSLAFSMMTQEVWCTVFKRLRDHMIQTYFPEWTELDIAEFEDILRGNQPP